MVSFAHIVSIYLTLYLVQQLNQALDDYNASLHQLTEIDVKLYEISLHTSCVGVDFLLDMDRILYSYSGED